MFCLVSFCSAWHSGRNHNIGHTRNSFPSRSCLMQKWQLLTSGAPYGHNFIFLTFPPLPLFFPLHFWEICTSSLSASWAACEVLGFVLLSLQGRGVEHSQRRSGVTHILLLADWEWPCGMPGIEPRSWTQQMPYPLWYKSSPCFEFLFILIAWLS